MARIRFVGDSEACVWLGVSFQRGAWIADHGLDEAGLARVAGNATFEVDDSEEKAAAAAAASKVARAKAAEQAATAKAAAKAVLDEAKAEAVAAAADAAPVPAPAGDQGLKVV